MVSNYTYGNEDDCRDAQNPPPEPKTAFERQVGGSHYKTVGASMQPWAIIDAWALDYYSGTVLTYLLRYPYKGGVEDLKKARHVLDRMIEKYND